MIDGVVGVIIWTEDMERMTAFYRDTLGLTPHSVRPDFVAFKWGDIRLSIGKHAEVKGDAKDPYRIMVNLRVGDIHGTHRSLAAKGVKFIRPPEKEHWGGWVGTFLDSDGNVLQLMELTDGGHKPKETPGQPE